MTQVPVSVVRGLFTFLKVLAIPAFMNLTVKNPQISPCFTVIGALEFRANERFFVEKVVDKELGFIKDSYMILLVLDLERACLGFV